MIQRVTNAMRHMINDDEPEDEPEGPFRPLTGTMPVPAEYDERYFRSLAGRFRSTISSEREVTDESLVETIGLPKNSINYHSDMIDADEREADREAIFHWSDGGAGQWTDTAEDVEWRGAWDVDLATAPADEDAFRAATSTFDLEDTERNQQAAKFVETAYWALRDIVEEHGVRVSTQGLCFHRTTPRTIDDRTLRAATELLATIDGVEAPVRDEWLAGADGSADWVYLPAENEAGEGEVARV